MLSILEWGMGRIEIFGSVEILFTGHFSLEQRLDRWRIYTYTCGEGAGDNPTYRLRL